jgi:hypothetical protein
LERIRRGIGGGLIVSLRLKKGFFRVSVKETVRRRIRQRRAGE